MNLQLYQRPTSYNTYTLDSFANGNRPFESLHAPSLATLRGSMKTNALAAYVLLMISGIMKSTVSGTFQINDQF